MLVQAHASVRTFTFYIVLCFVEKERKKQSAHVRACLRTLASPDFSKFFQIHATMLIYFSFFSFFLKLMKSEDAHACASTRELAHLHLLHLFIEKARKQESAQARVCLRTVARPHFSLLFRKNRTILFDL